ncbi:MAG TPA: sigma-70 family RNA polymerase sigma factor [Bacteroidales bacterium]|nr:sigma-70 family RNA polymerase sigma factor [Bacteroidales bacterium]HRZ49837.1 sigma-70 family RNA polymerase sigma factor [Bacteroidales bacterium]
MKEQWEPKEEKQILEKVRSGDNIAVGKLYRAHYPSVLHFVKTNMGDEDDAAEIYQQAFIILYEKLQEGSFTLSASAGTFLYAVARNLWLANLKERRRFSFEPSGMDPVDEEGEEMQVIVAREREFENLQSSLELIGEPCKTILKAYYHEKLSMEEIAAQLGYTNADNAKNQKYKCLMRLKRIFEKLGE